MILVADIQYLLDNFILYVILSPLIVGLLLLIDTYESYDMDRISRQQKGEPMTIADRLMRWRMVPLYLLALLLAEWLIGRLLGYQA